MTAEATGPTARIVETAATAQTAPITCIIVPAYNEEAAIAQTIRDYKTAFPDAIVVVIDNNSSDATSAEARTVLDPERDFLLLESRQGKGAAVKTGLGRVSADVYVMTDGDNTYPAADAARLHAHLLEARCDMVVGDRMASGTYAAQNDRRGHSAGNRFLTRYISFLAGESYNDVLSGLRIMSRPFVDMLDIRSAGFQLETELNVSAAYAKARVHELPIAYLARPEGSHSKLSTVRDGLRIGSFAFLNWIAFYPLQFFGAIAAAALTASLVFGLFVIGVFLETGSMPYPSTAVAAATMGLVGLQALFAGLVMRVIGRAGRRHDIARFLDRRRIWNARMDDRSRSVDRGMCQSTDQSLDWHAG